MIPKPDAENLREPPSRASPQRGDGRGETDKAVDSSYISSERKKQGSRLAILENYALSDN